MAPPAPEDPRYLERLVRALRTTAREVTPWFVEQMPDSYFRDTPDDTVVAHLASVVAARVSGAAPRMLLRDEERETWTFIQERSYRGLLSGLMEQLPSGRPLASAKVHTAADDSLILDVFRFGEAPRCDLERPELAAKLEEAVAYARGLGDEEAPSALPHHLARSSEDFVRAASPLRIHETWQLVQAVEGTDDVATAVSLQRESGLTRISVAAGNADAQVLLGRIVDHLGRRDLDITRAFLDVFRGEEGFVSSLGFVVHDPKGRLLDREGSAWRELSAELSRIPWLDDQVLARLDREPDESLLEAEVVVALSRLAHARMSRTHPHPESRDRVLERVGAHGPMARRVADVLIRRAAGDPASDLAVGLAKAIAEELETDPVRVVFDRMLEAALAVTRTNLHVEGRAGLALRVHPSFLEGPDAEAAPFGVLYVHGGGFDGFHVRFTDIARGGLRMVRPTSEAQHALEAERSYAEALGLARAQHLKNKDIPEGGSKGVVLLAPGGAVDRAARAFIDGVLDLGAPGGPDLAERPDAPIHLGPDEGISPGLIEWAVSRAHQREHPLPETFMSSRPSSGINHKDFGVTSEGVTVFLEAALRSVGIDPDKQAFTVKMTGGPDGDVAGNQLRILCERFAGRARVVAVADGSGAAWDPAGLDSAELLRLVTAEAGIARFDPERLGADGGVVSAETPEGAARRNTLCFDTAADAFIPAGGRPGTVHAGNWRRLVPDGQPNCRVVVEGANLFLTPEARRELSGAGVVVVKDSSANKGGVISSSLEIAAHMLLDEHEWVAHKARIAAEVITRLRELAAEEAQRLFADHARDPSTPLPEKSMALSRAILEVTEAVEDTLAGLEPEARAPLDDVVRAHLPPVLVELAGGRVQTRLSARYRDRVVAARLATRMVYREGIELLELLPRQQWGAAALRYDAHEREVEALVVQLRDRGGPEAERAAELLEAGGARAALFELARR